MGIVNVTPDSFSDGGYHDTRDTAIDHARRLVEEGADILDIGGESTRPGAMPVDVDEELSRVLPVLEGLRDIGVPLSIDTYKPEVMREAIAYGAAMINDVNALKMEGAIEAVANTHVAVCLVHKQGTPQTMQVSPQYDNVVAEVKSYLQNRVRALHDAGVESGRIVIDPGFGFGKNTEHNLTLLNNLSELKNLNVAVLAGLSRKSVLGKITQCEINDRLYPSVAAALIAVFKGADIVRVHDVGVTRAALEVYNSVEMASRS